MLARYITGLFTNRRAIANLIKINKSQLLTIQKLIFRYKSLARIKLDENEPKSDDAESGFSNLKSLCKYFHFKLKLLNKILLFYIKIKILLIN